MPDPTELDLFVRRLLYAYHGHVPRARDDRLTCAACSVDFGTASMAEMMQATRRAAIAAAVQRAAEACDAIGSEGVTPFHQGAQACAGAVRSLAPAPRAAAAFDEWATPPAASLSAAEAAARDVAKLVARACPAGWGFCLILFSAGPGGHMTYICNAERDGMVSTLRELIGQMEAERWRE